jgi:hypothetical protein
LSDSLSGTQYFDPKDILMKTNDTITLITIALIGQAIGIYWLWVMLREKNRVEVILDRFWRRRQPPLLPA